MTDTHPLDTLNDQRWRELRASLIAAGTLLLQAAEMTATDEIHPMMGLAARETMHAGLELQLLERDQCNQPLEGVVP